METLKAARAWISVLPKDCIDGFPTLLYPAKLSIIEIKVLS